MKYLAPVLLLIALAGLTYISRPESGILSGNENTGKALTLTKPQTNSIPQSYSPTASYNINCELLPGRRSVFAEEEMTWINRTASSTDSILIHLYPNAFKGSRTLYARRTGSIFEGSRSAGIELHSVKINGKEVSPEYILPGAEGVTDSTVASIKLDKPAGPGDSVRIYFRFTLRLPKELRAMGYASGRNFYLISQWFPKAGVFNGSKWICSHYYPYANSYSDFGNYMVKITVPENFVVAATGAVKAEYNDGKGKKTVVHEQYGIHDFAWIATDEILSSVSSFRRKNGSSVKINVLIQPENRKYTERYISAIKNSLSFFESRIGMYPYPVITLVDVPKTSMSGSLSFPALITAGAELFSPVETHTPEYAVVHGFARQYFYSAVACNELNEAWLSEGLSAYMTSKVLSSYYGRQLVSFRLFGYYPVFGLNFVSYNELPLIYSLGDFESPEGAQQLERYYMSPGLSAISDTSFLAPDPESYMVASYSKPELMLLSLERYLGFGKMMEIFRQYYRERRFTHAVGINFINTVKRYAGEDMEWFFKNIYRGTSSFDYSIRYVRSGSRQGEYEIFAERIGDGIFRQEIVLVTDKDTLTYKWNGEEKWKKITFRTDNKVLYAEIDPDRKNILDHNYANNSYTVNKQYGGSASLSFRWFFWIQNLLLYLGSVA